MATEPDLDTRLADEVTQLSTKLVTEVAKSSHLEEIVVQLRRENAHLKSRVLALEPAENGYEKARAEAERLQETLATLTREKQAAEAKNKQLEGEVEDLTASLFNEANEMVSNASREAYNYKLKNRKMHEELQEKDAIIENLQEQLRDLKALFVRMEEQTTSMSGTPRGESARFEFPAPDTVEASPALQQLLYGVRGRAVRFDLPAYQLEFKAFVCQLIKKDFSFDLASLKTLKYFRKLWVEEIEPCIPVIPSLSGNTFMNRWTKGKSFWTLLVEGKAIIEPVAGVNETFKLTYKGAKRGDEVPVALKDACAFCGEQKDDLLEHARLYNLKLYGPATETGAESSTDISGEPHAVVGAYPLCNFCLVKLRSICTFFATLRVIHSNIYKLPQNSQYDEIAHVNSFQFKRSAESLHVPESDPAAEPIFVKLYLMLLVLRAKIFWSRIGFWDTDEDVEFVNLDEVPLETFRAAVQDNVAFNTAEKDVVPQVIAQNTDRASVEGKKSGESARGQTCDVGVKDAMHDESDSDAVFEMVGTAGNTLDPAYNDVTSNWVDSRLDTNRAGGEALEKPEDSSEAAGPTEKATAQEMGLPAEPKPEQESVPDLSPEDDSQSAPTKNVSTEVSTETGTPEVTAEEPKIGPKSKKNKKKGKKGKKTDSVSEQQDTKKPEAEQEEVTKLNVADLEEDGGEGEFQDSHDTFDGEPQLSRKKSKSKEFKEKINKDLDSTLAALQESIE
ncbi:hypothetical protein OXX79_009680 [Metschnikowia pulcherrima]